MKNRVPELAAVLITVALLAIAVGFFWGRSTVQSAVVVEAAQPTTSPYVMPEGELVQEPAEDEVTEPAPTVVPDSVYESELVDINSADINMLAKLPGIGDVLAERIIDYRNEHGAFTSADELLNVEGIGDKKLEAIQNFIELG